MRAGVIQETSKLENGGGGQPGERVIQPFYESPPEPGAAVPRRRAPADEGAPQEEGAPVDRLDAQPEVPPGPGGGAPPEPPPPAPQEPAPAPPPGQPQPAPQE
jgi:general secretion pathway protein D